jgi:hypothetical protein
MSSFDSEEIEIELPLFKEGDEVGVFSQPGTL